jgi:hypothetical protein
MKKQTHAVSGQTARVFLPAFFAVICSTAATLPVAAIVPTGPIPVTSARVTINNGPGNHTDPHVSGDLAAYTDGTSTTTVRYYRFSTGVDTAIPTPFSATDSLSDVSGNRIAFTRAHGATDAIEVFDVSTMTTTEIDPQPGSQRAGSAIGNTTVAYIDYTGSGFLQPTGVTFAFDLSVGGSPVQLSSGTGTTQNPEVSPSGNAVVWEQCVTLFNCDVMKSIRSGGNWSPAALVVTSSHNPDTDGTSIVYDANRAGNPTGRDIYFQPLAGGAETQLQIAGEQSNPSIREGVIGFESRTSAGAPADIFVYVIDTNTLYQVTSTPTIDDRLNDVSVLPNGDVRVVWASNDGFGGSNNVYATTFTPIVPPAQQLSNLASTITGFNLPQGTANSLLAKVNAATDSLAVGDTTAACNELNALINEVNAQSGKKLMQGQAQAIVDAAQAIRSALGCP